MQQSINRLDCLTTNLLCFWVITVYEEADYCFLIGVYVSQSDFNHYSYVLNFLIH